MTSEREQEVNVPNPFLNAIAVWQNYLIYWIERNRNFYENAIKTNERSKYSGICGLRQEGLNEKKLQR